MSGTGNVTPAPRIKPSVVVALAVIAVYLVLIILIAKLLGDIPYSEISKSSGNFIKTVVVPVGVGAILIVIFAAVSGWRPFTSESKISGHKWLWFVPVSIVLYCLINLSITKWSSLDASFVLVILAGTLLVGFSEELLTRGLLAKALLGSGKSQLTTMLATSLIFGLMHAANAFSGQGISETVVQIISSALFGACMYISLLLSGSLILPILLHFIWDFSAIINQESGAESAAAIGLLLQIALFIAVIVSLKTVKGLSVGNKALTTVQ